MCLFMLRLSQIVWLLLFPLSLLRSQTLPIENATLNYRIICFSFPANGNSGPNKLEIALGHFNSLDSFKKNIIKTISSGKNNVIIELPYFGKHYSWRYSFTGKKSNTGQLHHFTTGDLPCADTNNRTRLRIIKSAVICICNTLAAAINSCCRSD